jgi:hypothetical protein
MHAITDGQQNGNQSGMTLDRFEHGHEKQSGIASNGRVISYNVNEGERPGGVKVRFKIRIATGKRAQVIDARQAAIIMEVLQWQRQQKRP